MLSFFGSLRQSLRRSYYHYPSTSNYDALSRESRFSERADDRSDWPDRGANGHNGDDSLLFQDDGRDDDQAEGNHSMGETSDTERENAPLLPIFEASHLDSLPVYSLTHAIRVLVVSKCDTTLSWDQLRSPQVSQFLIKPIQKEIMDNHFSKATVYALVANCLQFGKEAEVNPSIVGMSRSRAMVCELLAIRLLKEYSTRELIDVLSYDFYPLQGIDDVSNTTYARKRPQAARTSTLEVAIRATAKRFLAHPTVVQQLEAIWAGTIVFHHAADAAHRSPKQFARLSQYGTIQPGTTSGMLSQNNQMQDDISQVASQVALRRIVTLYDPQEASLLKLSRLRVPRYRHFLSTCSLAVFLALFLAVLTERSITISPLEVIFWFWSAGFMLDEVVGFNEQGFSLYIMSIWNAFDIGILLLLACFYILRLYSVLLLGTHQKEISYLAFDVLAANAILLFPRLFSILDHYRYFSQLLIAFRMMAQDLVAVFVLIAISCSGFFVAFTLSFGGDQNPGATAYALYQMLMGFTPTAWDLWGRYNLLGRAILVLFMIITHFLIVTILVTVLTNSFTAIVQNAHDEHQFVFAVNTISMVKSDALFSYIAPSNILGWLLTPLRYTMPFRTFVWMNRTAIKITHSAVLFSIFAYERLILETSIYNLEGDPIPRGRFFRHSRKAGHIGSRLTIFSPQEVRLREPSAATLHKDKALAEVFQRPLPDTFRLSEQHRKRRAAVDTWMRGMGSDSTTSPHLEQDRELVARLDRPQNRRRRMVSKRFASGLSLATGSHAASDPEEFGFNDTINTSAHLQSIRTARLADMHHEQSDNYGDDELPSHDDATERLTVGEHETNHSKESTEDWPQELRSARPRLHLRSLTVPEIPQSSTGTVQRQSSISFAESPPNRRSPLYMRFSARNQFGHRRITRPRRENPVRTIGHTATSALQNETNEEESSNSPLPILDPLTTFNTKAHTSATLEHGNQDLLKVKSPRKIRSPQLMASSSPRYHEAAKANHAIGRPLPGRFISTPSPPGSSVPESGFRGTVRTGKMSRGIDIASDLGDNKAANVSGLPASFTTQLEFAGRLRRMRSEERHDDDRRLNKLMLARMGVLEQGFREVLKEVKEMRESEKKRKKIRPTSLVAPTTPRRVSANAFSSGSKIEVLGNDGHPALMAIPVQEPEWIDEGPGEQRGSSV